MPSRVKTISRSFTLLEARLANPRYKYSRDFTRSGYKFAYFIWHSLGLPSAANRMIEYALLYTPYVHTDRYNRYVPEEFDSVFPPSRILQIQSREVLSCREDDDGISLHIMTVRRCK